MKPKILLIERKRHKSYSLERVFQQISQNINSDKFEISSIKLPYLSTVSGIIKNLKSFRPPQADIYHITGDAHYISLILPGNRTVLTIHDLNILKTRKGLRRYLIKKIFVDFPINRLKYITAVSEKTKEEILFYSNCPAEKITVIENPVNETYFVEPKKPFNSEYPSILHIGTAPHKNLTNLIKALEGIKCKLVIVGELNQETEKLLDEKKIVYTNKIGLDDRAMLREYQQSDIVAFCSVYEGFGLPVIEAQAMQIPLLTSNIEPLKTIAGEGANLCNPNDYSSIRKGIEKIIIDKKFRDETVLNGKKNVRRFQPKIIAARYEYLYEKMLLDLEIK